MVGWTASYRAPLINTVLKKRFSLSLRWALTTQQWMITLWVILHWSIGISHRHKQSFSVLWSEVFNNKHIYIIFMDLASNSFTWLCRWGDSQGTLHGGCSDGGAARQDRCLSWKQGFLYDSQTVNVILGANLLVLCADVIVGLPLGVSRSVIM